MVHNGRAAILTYHSLDEERSVLSTSPRAFAEQMQALHNLGVAVVPLHAIQNAAQAGTFPGDVVAITFDDGFRSVYEFGLPILQRYSFPATVFLVTDYCGKANSWPGQPRHVKSRPLLGWSEIERMSAQGVDFGSHTRTHPDLTALSECNAEDELVSSKKRIEDAVGQSVDILAYPYGNCNELVRCLARAHFKLACTTVLDFAGPDSDPLALERLDMYYLSDSRLFRRLFAWEVDLYVSVRRRLRGVRQRALLNRG